MLYTIFMILNDKISQKHPLVLAFHGDAFTKVFVSARLTQITESDVASLHKKSSKIVSAKNQSKTYEIVYDTLCNELRQIADRAFNAKHNTVPKNCTLKEYRQATAFEAIVGYLELSDTNHEKLLEILNILISEGS